MSSFAAVTILALACLAMANAELYSAQFSNWAVEHGKTYANDASYQAALSAFSTHEDTIRAHPADASFQIGHNSYSDMTWSEFRSTMKIGEPMPKSFKGLRGRAGNKVFECEGKCAEDTPAAIDWTTQGAVTEVKDQGQCGSCWSFSTTGSLEGAFFLAGNDLTEFSEQMLVDCDNNGDMGCNGGLMDNAFQWIESNGGICTEQDYPYQAVGGTCASSDCTVVAGSAPTTYTDVKEHSLSSMEAAVANAPVSIAIQADQPAFQLYTSGVMDGNCGHQLDHGVLAVGYGTDADSGEDFWKIKNSWGASWGEAGYIRISKGEAGRNGQCGILDCGSFPSV